MREVATPLGTARVTLVRPAGAGPRVLLALGHGAGGGVEAPDLQALAAALPARGIAVALVEQPWRVAGRRVAPAPARLDTAWRAVVAGLGGELPLVVGGRSAGARVACRTARATGAAGVVALAFPLHPPGRPERSRAGELAAADIPLLVVQGDRDPFGRPREFPAAVPDLRLVAVPGGDHGFAVPKRAPGGRESALRVVTEAVGDWLEALPGRS